MVESYYLFSTDSKRFNNTLLKALKQLKISEDNEFPNYPPEIQISTVSDTAVMNLS